MPRMTELHDRMADPTSINNHCVMSNSVFPAGEEAMLRDIIPGFNEVNIQQAQPLSQIADLVGAEKSFDITRIFPDLAGARSSSDSSSYPPILVLGSSSDISPSALRNFVRVNRQILPHDSTGVITDGQTSLEDNSVYSNGDDFQSREDSLEVVIPVSSSAGVPLSAVQHSVTTGSGSSTGAPLGTVEHSFAIGSGSSTGIPLSAVQHSVTTGSGSSTGVPLSAVQHSVASGSGSSTGVPLSAVQHSVTTGSGSSTGVPLGTVEHSFATGSGSSTGVPLGTVEQSVATGSGTSTLITDEADLDLSSRVAGPTISFATPGSDDSTHDVPVSTSAPSVGYSAPKGLPQGLQLLLNRHADQMTDPSMTLGSFLQGLNGRDGVMVLPASSLDAVQNAPGVSVTLSDPSSPESDTDDGDIHASISRSDDVGDFDLDLDLESREEDTLGIIASSNPSTKTINVVFAPTNADATTTTTTTTTTTRPVLTTTLSPTLFQGPLTELLYSKGQFFGTIIGSLLDLGTIIMNRIMNFKPF
ncbi:uncharacterized protein [Panulirus ornatus]|uniref:uncharacterized protein n=1 Tax=Panulirus ornatus TaxID=150431 RepID=UPI003A86A2A0